MKDLPVLLVTQNPGHFSSYFISQTSFPLWIFILFRDYLNFGGFQIRFWDFLYSIDFLKMVKFLEIFGFGEYVQICGFFVLEKLEFLDC